jgi:hypothetical protein
VTDAIRDGSLPFRLDGRYAAPHGVELAVFERTCTRGCERAGVALASFDGIDLVALTVEPFHSMVRIRSCWTTPAPVAEELTMFVHVTGSEGDIVGGLDHRPCRGMSPTSRWSPGALIADEFLVPTGLLGAGRDLRIGMYSPGDGRRRAVTVHRGPWTTDEGGTRLVLTGAAVPR